MPEGPKNNKNLPPDNDFSHLFKILEEHEDFINNATPEKYIEFHRQWARIFKVLNKWFEKNKIQLIEKYLTSFKDMDDTFKELADRLNAPLPDKKLYEMAIKYLKELREKFGDGTKG
jgi:hypothetical protein